MQIQDIENLEQQDQMLDQPQSASTKKVYTIENQEYTYDGPYNQIINEVLGIVQKQEIEDKKKQNQTHGNILRMLNEISNKKIIKFSIFNNNIKFNVKQMLITIIYCSVYIYMLIESINLKNSEFVKNQGSLLFYLVMEKQNIYQFYQSALISLRRAFLWINSGFSYFIYYIISVQNIEKKYQGMTIGFFFYKFFVLLFDILISQLELKRIINQPRKILVILGLIFSFFGFLLVFFVVKNDTCRSIALILCFGLPILRFGSLPH